MDYRKFKTPFFEITVSDPKGARKVKLPPFLMKLVSKIEIQESIQKNVHDLFRITFIEGSREPARVNITGDKSDIYQLDTSITGTITNRIGSLADLRFSGTKGLTWMTKKEMEEGSIDRNRRAHKDEPKEPLFLFERYNLIEIRWGYREDIRSARVVKAPIITIEAGFSDSDINTLSLTCSVYSTYTKEGPKEAINLVQLKAAHPEANIMEEVSTDKIGLVKMLCEERGLKCIISDQLPNNKVDSSDIWEKGSSFTEILNKLGSPSDVKPRIIKGHQDGKDYVVFVSNKDYETKPILPRSNLLTYKAPGSIIQKVSIVADINGLTDHLHTGVVDGKIKNEKGDGDLIFAALPGQSMTTSKPLEKVNKQTLDSFPDKETYGRAAISPNPDKEDVDVEAAQSGRMLQIRVDTIGYTRFFPGVIPIYGLGIRYSGNYCILQVIHKINDSGYRTELIGNNFSTPFGDRELGENRGQSTSEGAYYSVNSIKQVEAVQNLTQDSPQAKNSE